MTTLTTFLKANVDEIYYLEARARKINKRLGWTLAPERFQYDAEFARKEGPTDWCPMSWSLECYEDIVNMCAWEMLDYIASRCVDEPEEEDLRVTEELNAYEHMYTRNMRT